jgi:hypothetical protein
VDVARSRAGGGDLAEGIDQVVDLVGRAAEPEAGANSTREAGPPPCPQLGCEPVDLGVRYAEQPRDQQVRAEAAVAHPDQL